MRHGDIEHAIVAGTDGVLRVLGAAGMIDSAPEPTMDTRWSRSSRWMRASNSGILHLDVQLGDDVNRGDPIATIHDPFGKRLGVVSSRASGVVIGHTQRPLVNRGDGIVHVADIGDDEAP